MKRSLASQSRAASCGCCHSLASCILCVLRLASRNLASLASRLGRTALHLVALRLRLAALHLAARSQVHLTPACGSLTQASDHIIEEGQHVWMLDGLFNVAGILSDGEMWRARLVSVALACWYVAGKQGERKPEPNTRDDQAPLRSSSADLSCIACD